MPLFIRKPHALRLTEEGLLFKQYAIQLMDLADRSVEAVREIHQGLHGTVFLSTVEGNAPHLISQWIAGFHQLHPHVQYDLWNGNSDDVTTRVVRGLSELALIMAPYNTEVLRGIPVYEEPWVAIMSSAHPLAERPDDVLPLEALSGVDLLVPSRQSRQEEINSWFTRAGQKPPTVICHLSNTINAIELAEQNVGVAIYPASEGQIAGILPEGQNRICVKRLDGPNLRARYVLVRAKDRPLSRVASEFAHYVQDQVRNKTEP